MLFLLIFHVSIAQSFKCHSSLYGKLAIILYIIKFHILGDVNLLMNKAFTAVFHIIIPLSFQFLKFCYLKSIISIKGFESPL